MDRIEKIINIDNSRSHRNGLLPFVQYGGDGKIKEVTAIDTNGNYGQYVCDFCIYSGGTDVEIARLKYLDVLRNYYTVQECLRDAVYVKKTETPIDLISKVEQGKYENCVCAITPTVSSEKEESFKENFEEITEKGRYEYIPLDINLFRANKFGYVFTGPNIPEENRTEEEEALLEKVSKKHKELIGNSDFFVLVPNYDEVMRLNSWWNDWWVDNFKEDWENNVFVGYTQSDNVGFKFCEDVEKYILGQIEVVGSGITGSRVPTFVYYVNHFDLKNWFETHSATTVAAYEKPTKENEWIRYAWEERGGGNFYDFLSKNTPIWQTYISSRKPENYFKYVAPTMDLEVIINAEEEYETLYNVYEYSVNNGRIEGAVKPYIPNDVNDIVYIHYGSDGNGHKIYVNQYFFKEGLTTEVIDDKEFYVINEESKVANGLTKQWINCTSAYCESRLDTLIHPKALRITNDVFGVFEEFDKNDGYVGQLFECTYCTGFSKTNRIVASSTVIIYEYDDDGNIIDTKETVTNNIQAEECPDTPASVYQIFDTTILSESAWTETTSKEEKDKNNRVTKQEYYFSAFTRYEYGWWECEKLTDPSITCGDGENLKAGVYKYRNVLIVSCLPALVGPSNPGDVYYVMARYDNGLIQPKNIEGKDATIVSMKIPYKVDEPQNIVSYEDGTITYDKIISAEKIDTNKCLIRYAKGVTSGVTDVETGIHYEETLYYSENNVAKVPIDGIYMADLYYDVLGNNSEKTSVYSEEYRKYRLVRKAKIIGMEVGTQWTEENAVNAMLFTKDGYEGLQEEPKYDINLLYNRGNAAAWENHFKLSECNTMEDLVNYGNNFFNL